MKLMRSPRNAVSANSVLGEKPREAGRMASSPTISAAAMMRDVEVRLATPARPDADVVVGEAHDAAILRPSAGDRDGLDTSSRRGHHSRAICAPVCSY